MAVCMIFNPPKDAYSDETYEKILEHLGDGFPPSSMTLHLKGKTDAGEIRIVDVFESKEAFQSFAETHAPVYEKLGISLDAIMPYVSFFEVEKRLE